MRAIPIDCPTNINTKTAGPRQRTFIIRYVSTLLFWLDVLALQAKNRCQPAVYCVVTHVSLLRKLGDAKAFTLVDRGYLR